MTQMEQLSHTKQITLPDLPTSYHYPTPTHSPYPFSCGRSSALRSSLDTPLESYAVHRHRLRVTSHPTTRGSHTVQVTTSPLTNQGNVMASNTIHCKVPLSALSCPKAQLGAVGGSFNSTTKIKSIPLPAIYNRHQLTQKGIRSIRLHADRYTPSGRHVRTVSDSLLTLSKLHTRQMDHLEGCETVLKKSKSLKRASEVVPHRIERAFYMNGHSAQLFEKQDFSPEELRELEHLSLSQNPALYYGKGIRSGGGQSKVVRRFEKQFKQAVDCKRNYNNWEDINIDTGRYSRASRIITPGPPIPEEKAQDSQTFLTQSQRRHN